MKSYKKCLKKDRILNEIKKWSQTQKQLTYSRIKEEKEFNFLKKLLGLHPELGNRDVIIESLKLKLAEIIIEEEK